MASIFTKIIAGDIPSHKVYEDENYYAFLDIFPVQKGHTLIVPKKEVDDMFDLDDETLAGLYVAAKKVSKAIKAVFPCNRVGHAVIGLEVPHAHMHLIPINGMSDMNFEHKLKLDNEELAEIASKIREQL
ncbi:HIT family protein [Flammeovirga yaeyamensis]|uniref:HIT family protein n=1 Tax=Flammeovirga yaeyamensis TaxID=367791 RepID=A0AAX1N219_9BACT|nr:MULTISPECIES: HIT family protein [Flammeovirga]ANQ48509.1 HIT family protein [Flammeovirga sp. MY04]MBB3696403.1 histidine triad (HIT) family protein [Flammeovirga yaeyamensis]NMF35082.1 HIT family protein [Flammeovirga yaeyamensis]QWG00097.1 HIT family protein [Flammeovirga yaeyamensis]